MGNYGSKTNIGKSSDQVKEKLTDAQIQSEVQNLSQLIQKFGQFEESDLNDNLEKILDKFEPRSQEFIKKTLKHMFQDTDVKTAFRSNNITEFTTAMNKNPELALSIDALKKRMESVDKNIGTAIKPNVDIMINNLQGLRGKSLFYQYKYVESNLFLIMFALQVNELMHKTTDFYIAKFVEQQEKDRQFMVQLIELSAALSNQASSQDIDMKELNGYAADAIKKIKSRHEKITQQLKDYQENKLPDLLVDILKGNEALAQEVHTKTTKPT